MSTRTTEAQKLHTFIRALLSYARCCDDNGLVVRQPSRRRSRVSDTQVILRSVDGRLATYEIAPGGRLKRMESIGELRSTHLKRDDFASSRGASKLLARSISCAERASIET